jgi:hypothetical protein
MRSGRVSQPSEASICLRATASGRQNDASPAQIRSTACSEISLAAARRQRDAAPSG